MSLINTEIKPLKATAYHNGKFVPVTNADLNGKWSVLVFYPADFTFVLLPASSNVSVCSLPSFFSQAEPLLCSWQKWPDARPNGARDVSW